MMKLAGLMVLTIGCTRRGDVKDTVESEVPGDLLSVSESSSGRLLFISPVDGTFQGEICLTEALPEVCPTDPDDDERCLMFAAEHQLIDGESTFALTYSRRDSDVDYAPSGIISVTTAHPPEVRWSLDTLTFPEGSSLASRCVEQRAPECNLNGTHIITETGDGSLIAADTNNSRVLWITPGDNGEGEVTAFLDATHPEWDGWRNVNHVQVLRDGDRDLLLTTFKARAPDSGGLTDEGQLVMWDVTDPIRPARLWVWPEDGFLAAVHHGTVQETAAGTLLLYAHSLGASDDPDTGVIGSVGIARYLGPDTPPEYIADGVLPATDNPLGFVREVETFAPLDWLLITDSGCENPSASCTFPGRLLSAKLPDLSPEGQSGALGDQRFVELELLPDARRHQLVYPYDADLFYVDEIDADLAAGIGACVD
ncbi:MAG: hypothetical protein ACI8S6_000168 [Myxococcota bacterium]|jgi:hypothetical protein